MSTPSMLSPEQVERFREAGWIRLGAIASREQVTALANDEKRFRLGRGYGTARNDSLRVNIQLCNRSEVIRAFCTAGLHIDALQSLMGPNICLTHQQFVTKLPDTDELRSDIPLHQDNGYGRLDPMTDVTIWLPLIDTDANNGGLFVVSGSHKSGVLDHEASAINPVLREAAGEGAERVALAAGEAVAFSGLLLHGSGSNRSGAVRPAMYMRYCEPHVRMVDKGNRTVLEDPHSWMVAGEA